MPPSTLRVLLIDDEESDYLMTRALLDQIEGPKPEVDWASTYEDGLDRLGERLHDVCLLDYFLDDRTGLELLRQARSQAIRTPIILLTGKGSRDVDLEAMKSGAVDYLEKGAQDPEALERSLRYAVERHLAQEALRRSEERHRAMFDHLPLGLYRVTERGEYMEANPALIRMLDYPPRDVLEKEHAERYFVSPRDQDRFLGTIREQGVVLGFESEIRTGTGRLIRVRNTARVHRGPAGVIEYIEGSVEDVTSVRAPRDAVLGAAAFQAVMRSPEMGVLLTDPQGTVIQANEVALVALARSAEEAEGTVLWDLFDPEDGVAIAEALEEVTHGDMDSVSRTVRSPSHRELGRAGQMTATVLAGGAGPDGTDVVVVTVQPATVARET